MSKGIIYIMSTVVDGLIKIGKTDNFESRMRYLERNGYQNVTGLKRQFAIEVDDYHEKENLIHTIFDKSRIGETELFSVDLNLAKQLLSSFEGEIIFPKEDKSEIFTDATDAIEEKELNRHHFKEIKFHSSLTNKSYFTKTNEKGTLSIYESNTNEEVPSYNKPSKKQIVLYALKDLGERNLEGLTLYQLVRKLEKFNS